MDPTVNPVSLLGDTLYFTSSSQTSTPTNPATSSTAGIVKITDFVTTGASDTAASTNALLAGIPFSGYDIIVMGGQSNSVGHGSAATLTSSDYFDTDADIMELSFGNSNGRGAKFDTVNEALVATEALETIQNPGLAKRGANICYTFAKLYKMYKLKPGRKILIVHCGYDATTVLGGGFSSVSLSTNDGTPTQTYNTNWNPAASGNLYTKMLERIRIALAHHPITNPKPMYSGSTPPTPNPNNKVVAFLWHQGEGDGPVAQSGTSLSTNASNWLNALGSMASGVRGVANDQTVPFICGGFVPATLLNPNGSAWVNWVNETDLEYGMRTNLTVPGSSRYLQYSGFASSRAPTLLTSGPDQTWPGYSLAGQATAATSDSPIHFNSASLRIFGARYYSAYESALINTQNVPATLSGSLTTSVGTYDAINNIYQVDIGGFTSQFATTTDVYYSTDNGVTYVLATSGTLGVNPANPLVISKSSTSVSVIIKPSNTGITSYRFRVVVFNAYNTGTTPSLTTASSASIPQTPTPSATVTISSIDSTSIVVTASAVTNLIGADTVQILDSTSTVLFSTTVTAISAGYTITGLTASTSYALGARKVRFNNARNTLNIVYDLAAFTTTVALTQYPPAMTSDTTPSGYVASTSDYFQNNPIYAAFRAFNRVNGDRWNATGDTGLPAQTTNNITGYSGGSSAVGSWIQIQLPSAINLVKYTLLQTDNSVAINGWLLLGSNNGTNWTRVDERSSQTFGGSDPVPYTITGSPGSFSYYRLIRLAGVATMYEWALFA